MLALPFITEFTEFSGDVYASEPALQFARQYMEEMITYIERTPKIRQASRWKDEKIINQIPFVISVENCHPKDWTQIYTMKNVNASLSKVQPVGFNEKKNLFGSLEVTSLSSGHSIGSCNWLIASHHEKIGYISSSSTLTTHPRPIEVSPLKNADLVILNNLTQTPTVNPDQSLSDLCINVSKC